MTDRESPIVAAARHWVRDFYPYNRDHLLQSLVWLERIAPDAQEAVRIATVTHDMERAFPGPDQPMSVRLNDPVYDAAHAERSARIVSRWLVEQGVTPDLIGEVEALVTAHEVGGWPDADLVQAADSLSFLDTNIDLFLGFARSGRFPLRDVAAKFEHSYERIRVYHARELAKPLIHSARSRLRALEREVLIRSGSSAESKNAFEEAV